MNKPHITVPTPTHCHLWENPEEFHLKSDFLRKVKSYEEESHVIRRLLECEECRQLYFYEFNETIDWEGGNDPQYRTLIPVTDEEGADKLSKLNEFEILQYHPRLQSDWPKDIKEPKVWWNR